MARMNSFTKVKSRGMKEDMKNGNEGLKEKEKEGNKNG